MWKIKDIKKKGKQILKNNLWTLIIVAIFMSIVIGESSSLTVETPNLRTLEDNVQNDTNSNSTEEITEDVKDAVEKKDEELTTQIFGNTFELINQINKDTNVTKGALYTVFKVITKGQTQIQNMVDSIKDSTTKTVVAQTIIILASSIGILLKIFISNPIKVGEKRTFLESNEYKKTGFRRLVYCFKQGRYLSTVKTVFIQDLYLALWSLTIVGGIIKTYSYQMVKYIIAENPNIKTKDAIKMSREMMNGNKWHSFGLDLSFLGWNILEILTAGIAGIYVSPYRRATDAALYIKLREEYIDTKKYNYEQLNDKVLFKRESNEIEKYPDEDNLKEEKEYTENYSFTSIILFFFIFAFVGWVWEVTLYLFKYGAFINRGSTYGPWLPIYGVGCTLVILLTKIKSVRKLLKNPLITFNLVMFLCAIIEYFTAWYIEVKSGMKYWDYTGVFCNLNGRICLEGTLFFGLGGCICLYIVAPFLKKLINKMSEKVKIIVCVVLITLFTTDAVYSHFFPHTGNGITTVDVEKKVE